MPREVHHHYVLTDRGRGHVHRWWAKCTCGWVGIYRRRKKDARKVYDEHVNAQPHHHRAHGPRGPRPVTPDHLLPPTLRGDP